MCMKCFKTLFALLPFAVSSCASTPISTNSATSNASALSSSENSSASSSAVEDATLLLNAGFVFNHIQTHEGEKLATLLFDASYYTFSKEITINKPIVAGDQLNVTFNGGYDYFCQEVHPARCKVNGEIKSYFLIETQIIGVHVDDATIGDIADSIKASYLLDNEFVILDKEGRYIALEDYKGQDLYLSENRKKATEFCTCPEGAMCEPCPFYVAGLYAYDPRP